MGGGQGMGAGNGTGWVLPLEVWGIVQIAGKQLVVEDQVWLPTRYSGSGHHAVERHRDRLVPFQDLVLCSPQLLPLLALASAHMVS